MKEFGYYAARLLCRIKHSQKPILSFYRKHGLKIGDGCLICSYLVTREAFLIEIGSNVTVSTNVRFITHDNSAKLIFPDRSDLFGRIKIGNDCFIGENVIITKSVKESYTIVGGNPAKQIGTWDAFKQKYESKAIRRNDLQTLIQNDEECLVKR